MGAAVLTLLFAVSVGLLAARLPARLLSPLFDQTLAATVTHFTFSMRRKTRGGRF